jgi:hypothetical protein
MLHLMFIGLGALMALEFMNTYARAIGISRGALSVGMTVQNSLAVLARAISAFTLPTISLYADLGLFERHTYAEIAIANGWMPVCLFATYLFRRYLINIFYFMIKEIQRAGRLRVGYSIFPWRERSIALRQLRGINRAFFVAYFALYVAWPLTILCLKLLPDYRATVLSLTTVCTGINTLIITLIIDPKVAYIAKYRRVACVALVYQVRLKLYAAASAAVSIGLVPFVDYI